jgi:diaminopimelate epimerase
MGGASRAALASTPFGKYQGLGNDFVIVSASALAQALAQTPGGEAALARRLCDRRLGVGGDGLLVGELTVRGLWRMVVYNADGSRPQMCGNGLRCFVRWLVQTGRVEVAAGQPLVIETDAGPKRCAWEGGEEVEVEIGRAVMTPSALPMVPQTQQTLQTQQMQPSVDATSTEARLRAPWGEAVVLHGVSVGNPHAVVWEAAARGVEDAQRLGRWVCEHPMFPEQTNVEFVYEREDGVLEVVVYERGCGLTQACGTGAAAVVASWAQRVGAQEGARRVALPGGVLAVRQDREGVLWLRGGAAHVFDGEWRGERGC